jgi:hypothetical protein
VFVHQSKENTEGFEKAEGEFEFIQMSCVGPFLFFS